MGGMKYGEIREESICTEQEVVVYCLDSRVKSIVAKDIHKQDILLSGRSDEKSLLNLERSLDYIHLFLLNMITLSSLNVT